VASTIGDNFEKRHWRPSKDRLFSNFKGQNNCLKHVSMHTSLSLKLRETRAVTLEFARQRQCIEAVYDDDLV
jgi:hypothetical protein